MFNLIISIIAIALVCCLSLASIYYGGAAFEHGARQADNAIIAMRMESIKKSLLEFRDIEGALPSEGVLKALLGTGFEDYLGERKVVNHFSDDLLNLDSIDLVNLGDGINYIIASIPVENHNGFTSEHCVSIVKSEDVSCSIDEGIKQSATLTMRLD